MARLRQAMQNKLPRSMWRAYVEACVALADGLAADRAEAALDLGKNGARNGKTHV
jgi:anti-sigma factor ChrR (cupin superfamily)